MRSIAGSGALAGDLLDCKMENCILSLVHQRGSCLCMYLRKDAYDQTGIEGLDMLLKE